MMCSIGATKSTVWYAGSQGVYGEITRDLYAAWSKRLGQDTKIVPEEKVQQLFNDIGLYPSKSQIFEMVHCARRAGTMIKDRVDVRLQDDDDSDIEEVYETNFTGILTEEAESETRTKKENLCDVECESSSIIPALEQDEQHVNHIHNSYLTLGEFCVFATELRRRYDQFERSEQEGSKGEYLVCHKKDCSGRRNHTYKKCKHHHHHHHHPYRHHSISKPGGGSKGMGNLEHNPDGSSSSSSSGNSSTCSINQNIKKSAIRAQKSTSSTSAYDVFLGGSCNPTTWRQKDAIPYLKSQSITYYNPQQANWVPEMMELEHQAKQSSRVLLMVVANATRNVASMIEIAYFAGNSQVKGRRLVTYIETYPGPGHLIQDEAICEQGIPSTIDCTIKP